MCCRTDEFKVAPKVKGSKVWRTNCRLEHTHVCCSICQSKAAPMDQGLQGFGRPRASVRTHIARALMPCRIDQTRVAPTDQGLQRFGRATADVSIHMCVAKCINSGCTRESKVTTEWHQGLQGFGRPFAAGSIYMCVPKCVNSKLHPSPPWVKGYKGLADQLLL